MFIDVFVQGKGIWIRYNGRTVGPRYGTRKEQSVSFSGMESAVATLRGTKRKAESNRVQSLRESKVILLPERKTASDEVERAAHVRPLDHRCVCEPCAQWRRTEMIRERDEQAELEYLAASISSDEDDDDEDYVYDYDPNGGGGGGSSSDSSDSSSSESDDDDDDGNNNVNRVPVEIVDLIGTADIVEGIAEGGAEPIHTAIELRDVFLR